MVRWQPGARERLIAAAMGLFADQGFERTTVADIATAADLTERTFFRHFSDKREVLFSGQDEFERVFTDAVVGAPDGTPPMEIAAAALTRSGAFFSDERRPHSRARQTVIDGEPDLQERELLKMAKLKRVLADALRERDVPAVDAALTAETTVGVFQLAFAQWITPGETRSVPEIADALLGSLRRLTV